MLTACSLSLALTAALSVPAPEVNPLQWRFRQGDVFYVENTITSKQTIIVLDNKQVQDATRVMVSRYTVKKVNPDRSVVLAQEILKVDCKGDTGEKLIYELFVGLEFTITLDAKGKVAKVEGYKDLLARADKNDSTREMMKLSHSEDTFKDGFVSFFELLPGKPVSVGNTWNRESTVGMGPLGKLATDTTYKYAGSVKREQGTVDRVTFTAKAKFQPGDGDIPGGAFKVKSADLKMEPVEGEYQFDRQKGRLVEMRSTTPIKGTMTLDIGGMEIKMEMEGTQQSQCRVLDQNPIKQ